VTPRRGPNRAGPDNVSADFIILRRPEAPPKDTSPAALAHEWFAAMRGVSPETVARLRGEVKRKLETGACRHLLPKMPPEHVPGVELQACIEQVVTEQRDSLTP
jgi:hypothetical protein